jgi:hypothetical protein
MIAPDVVQQLEAARFRAADELARLDKALAALREPPTGPVVVTGPIVITRGRPVKKAASTHSKQHTTRLHPFTPKVKPVDGKRTGRAPTWDVVKAEQLWKNGVAAQEIADRTGATGAQTIYERAARCKWGKRQKAASATKKCRACGSTVTPGQACPACGVPA